LIQANWSFWLINTINTVTYPNRNFMKKAIFLLMAAVALMTVPTSQAGLGWTFDQCVERYGPITSPNTRMKDGAVACSFTAKGYHIVAYFTTNVVSRIAYERDSSFDTAGVADFLRSNAPGADWRGPEKDDSDGSYRWQGTVDGAYAFSAGLTHNGHILVIWTKENNDYGSARDAEEASGL
jgi:hypothetical protein